MATYYGVNKTKARLGTSAGSNILAMGLFEGKVRCMVDTYVVASGSAAADVIEMGGTLPKGAHVLETILSCNASVGATSTIDVGDYEDVDRYIDGVNCASAAINRMEQPDTGAGYKVAEAVSTTLDSQIILTLVTLATPVAGTIITLVTLYTIE